ncbi:MAG: thioesterase [Lysobacteraceae bacterium]|nr:MAG: thioesterase [Xanthomonadaceae bacterium]
MQFLERCGAVQKTQWLIRSPSVGHKMRLFCFAYAGGNAFYFNSWRSALDARIEVCAVQLPGRGSRIAEAPIGTMPAMLKALAPVVTQHGCMPYAFFGHSVGALIAFELARYLRLHSIEGPKHLFVSGCQAPRYRSHTKRLHQLPDHDFIEQLRSYNGTPAEVLGNKELMSLMLPTIRADFSISEEYAYRPGPLLKIPISVYAGVDDDNKEIGQVDGWSQETTGDCRVTWFDGGHFFIDTQTQSVLKQLDYELADYLREEKPPSLVIEEANNLID